MFLSDTIVLRGNYVVKQKQYCVWENGEGGQSGVPILGDKCVAKDMKTYQTFIQVVHIYSRI